MLAYICMVDEVGSSFVLMRILVPLATVNSKIRGINILIKRRVPDKQKEYCIWECFEFQTLQFYIFSLGSLLSWFNIGSTVICLWKKTIFIFHPPVPSSIVLFSILHQFILAGIPQAAWQYLWKWEWFFRK